jgi:hypothetical protein
VGPRGFYFASPRAARIAEALTEKGMEVASVFTE